MKKLSQIHFGLKSAAAKLLKGVRDSRPAGYLAAFPDRFRNNVSNLPRRVRFSRRHAAALALLAVTAAAARGLLLSDYWPPGSTEPKVTISTEGEEDAENDLTGYTSPAERANPGLSESATLPTEKGKMSVSEKVNSVGEASDTGQSEEAVAAAAEVSPENMYMPVSGEAVRGFGFVYSETFEDYRFHRGIDFKAEMGASVRAALPGKVESVENNEMSCYNVILNHGSGWKTVYSHVEDVKVEKGSRIEAGEELAVVAAPGREESAIGPHLHFELLHKEEPQNPANYLPQ